ncbi:MAG: Ig-like domain-containing protein, partial [Clostridia bacterium]|nr:Ig-like domain-containing protein [Clostridia bacterium]
MKLFRQMIALLLCAAMIFSLAVSASADSETNSPDSGAAAPVSETNDDPYEQENPGEQNEDADDEDDEEDADDKEQDEDEEDDEKLPPELDLHAQQVSVSVGAKIQLKAEPKNFESTPSGITWSSENPGIAAVDGRGTVTG